METLFIYIAKSSGLIALFYIAYFLLLRKETFFTANRWFLLGGLLTSVILPWIVFTTIVWVEPTPTDVDWSKIPMTPVQEESFEINWYWVGAITYSIGILTLLIQFAFDFYNLNKVLKGKKIQQQADHKFIDLEDNIAPFSYFNTIVYNSSLYSEAEMESILEHEKVHSEQYHTLDVLITRFFCILFWFNPFMWLYKNAILQNLEFIADSEASKNISDKKAYQLTLLKITTHENCVVLTNHFYQSLIKKRIVMLNKNQSKKWNSLKYALVIPVLVAFVLCFQVEVIAQEKTVAKEGADTRSELADLTSVKTDQDLASLSKGKEIYIDGKKSSGDELAKVDPNEILNVDVIKKSSTPTIMVTTKNAVNQTTKTVQITDGDIYIDGVKSTKADMDKLDPKDIASMDVINDGIRKEIRIITKKHAKLANENDVYINDKKVEQNEFEQLNQNEIVSMNVNKNGKTIHIVTKNGTYTIPSKDLPVPPVPPTPPLMKKVPPAPPMPKAPKAPKGDPITGDKKAWKEFEKEMEEFDAKMKKIQPQMEALDKQMAQFDKQMEPFNKEMEAFDEKMKAYDKQIQEYVAKIVKEKENK